MSLSQHEAWGAVARTVAIGYSRHQGWRSVTRETAGIGEHPPPPPPLAGVCASKEQKRKIYPTAAPCLARVCASKVNKSKHLRTSGPLLAGVGAVADGLLLEVDEEEIDAALYGLGFRV